jgi:hypothetical protein
MEYKTKEQEREDRKESHVRGLKNINAHLEFEVQRAASPAAALSLTAMQSVLADILEGMES